MLSACDCRSSKMRSGSRRRPSLTPARAKLLSVVHMPKCKPGRRPMSCRWLTRCAMGGPWAMRGECMRLCCLQIKQLLESDRSQQEDRRVAALDKAWLQARCDELQRVRLCRSATLLHVCLPRRCVCWLGQGSACCRPCDCRSSKMRSGSRRRPSLTRNCG